MAQQEEQRPEDVRQQPYTLEDTATYVEPGSRVPGAMARAITDGVRSKAAPLTGDIPPKVDSTGELIGYLRQMRDANRRLTKDEVERLRRQQRTEETVSGISDAMRSLSNLFFASKGAPSMYDHTKGMSAATRARWERTMKEREAENDRWYDYAIKAHSLEAQQEAQKYQHGRDRLKDEREEREQTRKEEWDAWRIEDGKLDNEIKQAELAVKVATGQAKVEAERALANAYEARARLYDRTPKMGGTGRGGSTGGGGRRESGSEGYYTLTMYDTDHNYHNQTMWEQAIIEAARDLGIPRTEEVGVGPNSKTYWRDPKEVAIDIKKATAGKTPPRTGQGSGGTTTAGAQGSSGGTGTARADTAQSKGQGAGGTTGGGATGAKGAGKSTGTTGGGKSSGTTGGGKSSGTTGGGTQAKKEEDIDWSSVNIDWTK